MIIIPRPRTAGRVATPLHGGSRRTTAGAFNAFAQEIMGNQSWEFMVKNQGHGN
jgi:hypothetical protein